MDDSTLDLSNPTQPIGNVIRHMIEKLKLEAANKILISPEDIEGRVSLYTGIPYQLVTEIGKKNITTAKYPKPNNIDFTVHLIVLRSLLKFYKSKEMPTFPLLFRTLNSIVNTGLTLSDLKQHLSMLGFGYHPIFNDARLFMEDPKISFERYLYLKKMKPFRLRDTHVYYISAILIDKHIDFYPLWKQNIQISDIPNDEYVFFHAISKKGFTNGLFCYSPTEDDFYKWVVDILLGLLKPSSVVVLGNSPLYGTANSKSISMFDTKNDMVQWLRQHNVPCSYTMHKSELYQLIQNTIVTGDMPRVDRVIKANGHEVLRMPTHFEDLSAIEIAWEKIKTTLKSRPLLNKNDVRSEILSLFEEIPAQNYELFDACIKDRENLLLEADADKDLDDFITHLKKLKGSE